MSKHTIRKPLSLRLDKAVTELEIQLSGSQIRAMINAELDKPISAPIFSRMRKLHSKVEYATIAHESKFSRVLQILDRIIMKELGKVWNKDKKNYTFLKEEADNPRLRGLIGNWIGYAWDAVTSETTKIDHLHIFKVSFKSVDDIHCEAKGGKLYGNKMMFIGNEKVAIEMTHPDRKIYLVIHIGTKQLENIMTETRFKLAYVDSGTSKVKAGLALIERAGNEFDKVVPEKRPFAEVIATKDAAFADFMNKEQLVIN